MVGRKKVATYVCSSIYLNRSRKNIFGKKLEKYSWQYTQTRYRNFLESAHIYKIYMTIGI